MIAKYAEAGSHKAEMVRYHLLSYLIGSAMAGAYIGVGDIFIERRRQTRLDGDL